ncbi:MAG: glycosyltransferase [Rhodobacteraceae bacterium]|nr:glycosyltransferase [Paracoccaceae bacterium]
MLGNGKPRLLMIAPAPVIELPGGKLRLDVKFVEGMHFHVAQWDGPVTCILKRGAADIPFGATYDLADLDFTLKIIDRDAPIEVHDLSANDLIFAGADMHDVLHLAALDQRPAGTKLVYAIEYDLDTRMRIASLDRHRSFLRKLRSGIWLLNQERRRRAALRGCDGVQANGYPAFSAYSKFNRKTMLYLDGRMGRAMMATPQEQATRALYQQTDAPLRLVHSGRLEPLKGGQDLIPVAKALHQAKVNFTLDIFGSGSLGADIAKDIAAAGLSDTVRLHDPVDFETVLVPFLRQQADLFVSCHRQSDPSCTYLECLGCGIPVVGYKNAMWQDMAAKSGGGWAVTLGQVNALADKISALSRDPAALLKAGHQGLEFARAHAFEAEFSKRMAHLADIARAR